MDNTFYTAVALFIFLAILAYIKIPSAIAKTLDDRSEKIKNDLSDARRLRDEAQSLLEEYKKKQKDAVSEAAIIIENAQKKAKAIEVEAKIKSDEYVKRRTLRAEQKIAQAESDAISMVRNSVVDISIAASQKLLENTSDKSKSEKFDESLNKIQQHLN